MDDMVKKIVVFFAAETRIPEPPLWMVKKRIPKKEIQWLEFSSIRILFPMLSRE